MLSTANNIHVIISETNFREWVGSECKCGQYKLLNVLRMI